MRFTTILPMLALLLSACAALQPAPDPADAFLSDCDYQTSGGTIAARCGTLEVPEQRAGDSERSIALKIVVLPALSRTPADDPVFLLAGGPGQASTEAFAAAIPALDAIRQKHDLVLVDQRGTGDSNPLSCPTPIATPTVVTLDPSAADAVREMDACLKTFAPADLSAYTTQSAAQDLDAVRDALGYAQIDLLGVSYGTRLALTYAALYPDQTRVLILDGVVPLGWTLGESIRADAQHALEGLLQRCAADEGCQQSFPRLRADLFDTLDRLQAAPEEVIVPDPTTAQPRTVRVDAALFAATLRLMTYSDLYTALAPLMIQSAAAGDLRPAASHFLLLTNSLDTSMSTGLYYAVWCAEDLPHLDAAGELGDYYFPYDLKLPRQLCDRLPKGASAAVPVPARTDIPTLLISGADDPVTPPRNADAVAQVFPNSRQIVLPGMAHNNVFSGCVPRVVRDLLDTPDPAALDLSCLGDIRPMPFFVRPAGPTP